MLRLAAVSAVALSLPLASRAAAPQPLPAQPPITAPQDKPYPGQLRIEVDATDLDRRIFNVRETVPVSAPGRFTLLYPRWIPGGHTPRGELYNLAGLIITANGQRLAWERDPVEIGAFHVDVPPGVRELNLQYQLVTPTDAPQGRVLVTPEIVNLQWISVILYPAGYFTRQIPISASLRLPDGWGFGTALESSGASDGMVRFKPVSVETLADSPVFAGRWFRKVELDPGGRSRVTLDIVADDPQLLAMSDRQVQLHRDLIVQADRLYGARHYDHYDMLLSLSDRLGGIGLEHQRSSEDGTSPRYFTDWDKLASTRELLPHEYTHSWNGKYRRPADLWTPNFNVPMRDSLLWVYEGQTQYWGTVLAARSGLLSRQEALDSIASTAAAYDYRIGRTWRQLQDTTNDPIIASRRPLPWTSWQRSEDYYSEGQLIWMDVDTLIRERSGGRRSLDDFARAFFGVNDGDWSQLTYTFDDVVRTLNEVEPYDWAKFLRTRLDGHGPGAPLDGLDRGGYRLAWSDTPTDYYRSNEYRRKINDLTYSVGLVVKKDGELSGVQWDGPAFKAGLTVGQKIIAVNGDAFDPDRLTAAIAGAKGDGPPVQLIMKNGDRYRVVTIAYNGGLRYPRLERIAGAPDRLGEILAPRR